MLSHYIVLNDRDKRLMVLRPYQVFAVEAIVDKVRNYTPPTVLTAPTTTATSGTPPAAVKRSPASRPAR
jgi:hypothetical protein